MAMSTHLWSRVQAAGLHPGITTLDQYEELATLGLIRARLVAQAEPVANPGPSLVAAYHKLIFEQVYPWASQFRQLGELAIVGGAVGAEFDRIVPELEMLNHQTRGMLQQAQNDAAILRTLAFAHVRFERIHPFRDGNGRLGRVLLDGQLNATLGAKLRPVLQRDRYLAALEGSRRKDLADLVNLLAQREGIAHKERQPWSPPFRLAPFMADGTTRSLEEDLMRSRVP